VVPSWGFLLGDFSLACSERSANPAKVAVGHSGGICRDAALAVRFRFHNFGGTIVNFIT
jgi:hypothetical protein